jgi:hypothetical protein
VRCWANPGEAGLGCHRVLDTLARTASPAAYRCGDSTAPPAPPNPPEKQTVTFGANLLRFPKSGHPDGLSSRGQTLHVNKALIWHEVLCAADFRARIGARLPIGRVGRPKQTGSAPWLAIAFSHQKDQHPQPLPSAAPRNRGLRHRSVRERLQRGTTTASLAGWERRARSGISRLPWPAN